VSGTVLVVGSVNVDLVVSVDRLPGEGETVTGGRFARHGGGKGANQAVAAARAGARVVFLGAVGDDDHGAEAVADLRGAGVDVAPLVVLHGEATGVAAIVVAADGANQIAVASGANALLDEALVRERLGAHEEAFDVLLVNHETSDDANLAAIAAARRVGARIVVNPAPARPLSAGVLAAAPVLTPNADEARALTGEADMQGAVRALHAATGAPVAVTLGADGVLSAEDGRVLAVPAPQVAAVDTTGAGDAFSGTLAAQLASGASFAEAVAAAIASASRAVTVRGARG
jgi:ribokinase